MNKKFLSSERIKSAIIVVLFIMTVLLSYLYWQDDAFNPLTDFFRSRLSSQTFTTAAGPEMSSLVCPESVSINYGDGNYNMYINNADTLWDEFLPIYKEFSDTSNLMIEEIEKEQWNEAMDYAGISFNFGYDVPNEFFESLGVSNYGQTEYFDSIFSVACTEAAETALFVQNRAQNRYFRIMSDSDFLNLEEALSNLKSGKTINGKAAKTEGSMSFYPLNMLIGSDNRCLLPYQSALTLQPVKMETQSIKDYEKSLAETFFGKSLDFVRKVTDDSGTILYMYGYNQISLSIHADGYFEYTDTTTAPVRSISFNQAMSLASDFIAEHGSWSSYNTDASGYVLREAEAGKKNRNSFYRFCFGPGYNNYPIYGREGSDIVIEITGNQVTYFKRNAGSITTVSLSPEEATETAGTNSSICDIILSDYVNIAAALNEMGENLVLSGETYGENMEQTIESLLSVSPGYFQSSEEETVLTPAWILRFDRGCVFYDMNSGAYLGFTKDGEE